MKDNGVSPALCVPLLLLFIPYVVLLHETDVNL